MFAQLLDLIKTNRFVRIALGATLGIGILILIFSPQPEPTAQQPITQSKSAQYSLTDFSAEELKQATNYRSSIIGSLPIYHEGLITSTGLTTTINIFVLDSDPDETVRFEVYGLSYLNSDTNPFINPNITAFAESHTLGLELMKKRGIDSSQLIFLYSDIDYIRTTISTWLDHLGLLN